MNKTVLVIGSVTAAQYKDARLSVLQQGHKPVVVRTSLEKVSIGRSELLSHFSDDMEDIDDLEPEEYEEIVSDYALDFVEQEFGNIGAVIMPAGMWFDTAHALEDRPVSDYLTDQEFPRWIIHEDGSVEFAG